MQKKILSAVLSLFLVGSASSAFAEYYDVNVTKTVDINDSFKDQSDDDYLDLDLQVSKSVAISDSYNKNVAVNKTTTTNIDINAQGNFVKGKFVVQQFGGTGLGNGNGGSVINVDNSINYSDINSYNDTNSHNKTLTLTKTKTYNENINNSYNKTSNHSRTANVKVDIYVDKSKTFKAYRSFNRNQLGGRL